MKGALRLHPRIARLDKEQLRVHSKSHSVPDSICWLRKLSSLKRWQVGWKCKIWSICFKQLRLDSASLGCCCFQKENRPISNLTFCAFSGARTLLPAFPVRSQMPRMAEACRACRALAFARFSLFSEMQRGTRSDPASSTTHPTHHLTLRRTPLAHIPSSSYGNRCVPLSTRRAADSNLF